MSYAQTIIGKSLPNLKGNTLAGKALEIPKDIKGKITFISFGFSQASSKKSEVWFKNFLSKYLKEKNIEFYAFPMLGDNPLVKTFGPIVEKGLKNQVKKEGQEHAMMVYQALDPIKKYIGYDTKEDTYLYLTDKKGNIVWAAQGAFSQTKFNEISSIIKEINK